LQNSIAHKKKVLRMQAFLARSYVRVSIHSRSSIGVVIMKYNCRYTVE